MAIRRKDFVTEILTDGDLEAVQDNGNIQVDLYSELSSLPTTVNTAYVKADESVYIRRASSWIKLAKEVSITAGTGLTGGGSLSSDRTLSINKTTTDGWYDLKGHTHTFASLTSKPTTLSGFGITDAVINTRTISAGTGLTGGGALSANRTLSLDTTYTDGRYLKASGETRLISTTNQVRGTDFVGVSSTGHSYSYYLPSSGTGWRAGRDNGASGAFCISRTTSSGTWQNNPFVIQASDGNAVFAYPLHAQGGLRLMDATVVEGAIPGTDHMRFLYYDQTGSLRRANIDTMRLIINASTRRFKTDIADAQDVPDVTDLKPSVFKWKEDAPTADASREEGYQLGLIAEDVEEVDKRLVWHDSEGNPAGLNHSALIAALIAKVTELESRIEELEAK